MPKNATAARRPAINVENMRLGRRAARVIEVIATGTS
jgi:hypothetical protein